jgi:hypothetical protein
MQNSKYELKGAKEVTEALNKLPVDLQAKILRSFLSKAGRKFVTVPLKAKLNYSEKIENSIKVVNDSKNKLAVSAGVTGKGYKLRWVDLGTKPRTTKKGYNRGLINGKDQIQTHILDSVEPIIDYTNKELGNEVNKILERRLKKLKK